MTDKLQIPHSYKRVSDAITIHLKQFESSHPEDFTFAHEREGFGIEYFRFRFARRGYEFYEGSADLGSIRIRQLNTRLTEMVMEDSSRLDAGPELFLKQSVIQMWEDEEEPIEVPSRKLKTQAAAKLKRFKAIHQKVRQYIFEGLQNDRLLEVEKTKNKRVSGNRTSLANVPKKVFISYAHEDQASARRLYGGLKGIPGVEPWFDKESLLPGIKWKPAIKKAIRESDFFLALLSKSSISKRGYVQTEMKEAFEIWDQFPEDKAFLIPIRLEDCDPSYEKLREVQYQDFFPNWERGFQRVLRVINAHERTLPSNDSNVAAGYEYRCAIVDFDNGLTNLPQICAKLNSIQNFFHFSAPTFAYEHTALREFDGTTNLFVPDLPSSLYKQKVLLNADLVVCLTRYLLAFVENKKIYYDYLSLPSDADDTFKFVTTYGLYEAGKKAGCTFEKAIVYHILTQLLIHFASDLGFHTKVRGCILDFCEEHSWMIKGMKQMRLCRPCAKSVENLDLKKAALAILADAIRV